MDKKIFYELGTDKDDLINQLLEFNIFKLFGKKTHLIYSKDELNIKLDFEKANIDYKKGYLEVIFDGARLEINEEIKVSKVKRPSNTIGEYVWCYKVCNKDNELLAYIGCTEKFN